MTALPVPAPSPPRGRAIAVRLPLGADGVYATLLGLALALIAILGNGGLRVGALTALEIVLDIVCGLLLAAAALAAPRVRRFLPGTLATAFFAIFVVYSAISIVWSILPDQSWLEANRLITYLAVFGAGLALVRLAPQRWSGLVGAITIACVGVSFWALLHKTFPAGLDPDEPYARLRAPFGYWNAVGLMAALGLPGCLWLGARRTGATALNALAYPAAGLLLVVMLLAYSRGSLLAAALGCGFWFATVPLRLRGFAVLATAAAGAAAVIAWVFSQDALTRDEAPLPLRDQAGLQLFVAMVFVLVLLYVAGLAVSFARDRTYRSPLTRRRLGVGVGVLLALVPLGVAVKLASTDRGLGGSISHAWTQLTDPHAPLPQNSPGRLSGVASVRARYWNEALKIFRDRPLLGVGLGSYKVARQRYRSDFVEVQHAHGYVVQVLADRGVIGLLLSLAALAALGVAIAVATGLRRGASAVRTTPERVGLLTLAAVVVTFGVHSTIDWTWFIPGVAIPALLAGGWLAGRGRYELPPRAPLGLLARFRTGVDNRNRAVGALLAAVLGIVGAWVAWQPQRAADAGNRALDALAASPPRIAEARRLATLAHRRNPLSVEPLFDRAVIEGTAKNIPRALQALQDAVRLQPGNPATWTALADLQLRTLHQPAAAKRSLAAALYLDPRSPNAIGLLIEANRELAR